MHAVYGQAKANGAVTRRHARERRHPQFAAARPAGGGSLRAPEADLPAETGRRRDPGMGPPDGGEAVQHRRRHGRRAAPVQIDMQEHDLAGRRVIVARIVEHRMRVVDALLVETEQMGGEAQRVAAHHFAQIGNVGFENEDRPAGLLICSGPRPI